MLNALLNHVDFLTHGWDAHRFFFLAVQSLNIDSLRIDCDAEDIFALQVEVVDAWAIVERQRDSLGLH